MHATPGPRRGASRVWRGSHARHRKLGQQTIRGPRLLSGL